MAADGTVEEGEGHWSRQLLSRHIFLASKSAIPVRPAEGAAVLFASQNSVLDVAYLAIDIRRATRDNEPTGDHPKRGTLSFFAAADRGRHAAFGMHRFSS